ncbi:MAG: MFS transporter [Candidatus Thiodiazotropha sp. DIVDIV]
MSLWQKQLLWYGLPGFPLAFLGLPLVIFLPPTYAEEFGLGMASVGLLLMFSRLWDLCTDPLAGYLGDRINIKSGRRRIMIYSGAPLLLISCYMLFIPSSIPDGVYLLVWSALLYTGWTWVVIPYTAWGAELSTDYTRRSQITSVREIYVLIGTLAVVTIPLLIVDHQSRQLLEIVGAIFILTFLLSMPGLLFVPNHAKHVKKTGFKGGLKLLKSNGPLKKLLFAYLLNGIANAIPASLFLLYVEFALGLSENSWLFLSIYFASGLFGLLVWLPLSHRIQKHSAWAIALLFSSCIFIWVPFLPAGEIVPFLLVCLLTGLSLGIDMSLPAAIQADVIDIDRAEGGGERAGLFFGLWGMATKLSLALAIGLVYPLVQFSGFDPLQPTEEGIQALILAYGLLPIPFKLIAAWIIWHFPLGSQQLTILQRSNQSELQHQSLVLHPVSVDDSGVFKHETH